MSRLERLRDQLQNTPIISDNFPHYLPVDLTGSPELETVNVYIKDVADYLLAHKDIEAARRRGDKRAVRKD